MIVINIDSNLLEFDELKMYFGEPYKVNDYISIHTPTIGEIIDFGEKEYYSVVYTLTSIPSNRKSELWDCGIDYELISDFKFFYIMTRSLTKDKTKLLFGDLDLSAMNLFKDTTNDLFYMIDNITGAKIDELSYFKIVGYLRKLHNITPKIEKAGTKTVKKILIELDRQDLEKNKNKPYKSQLKPLISAMMRYPGFKYKSKELKEISIYEFMDTVKGSQIYVNSIALLQGSYSGMIDTSKINKKEFNWLRDVSE